MSAIFTLGSAAVFIGGVILLGRRTDRWQWDFTVLGWFVLSWMILFLGGYWR